MPRSSSADRSHRPQSAGGAQYAAGSDPHQAGASVSSSAKSAEYFFICLCKAIKESHRFGDAATNDLMLISPLGSWELLARCKILRFVPPFIHSPTATCDPGSHLLTLDKRSLSPAGHWALCGLLWSSNSNFIQHRGGRACPGW